MASYNFFYNPATGAPGISLQQQQQQQQHPGVVQQAGGVGGGGNADGNNQLNNNRDDNNNPVNNNNNMWCPPYDFTNNGMNQQQQQMNNAQAQQVNQQQQQQMNQHHQAQIQLFQQFQVQQEPQHQVQPLQHPVNTQQQQQLQPAAFQHQVLVPQQQQHQHQQVLLAQPQQQYPGLQPPPPPQNPQQHPQQDQHQQVVQMPPPPPQQQQQQQQPTHQALHQLQQYQQQLQQLQQQAQAQQQMTGGVGGGGVAGVPPMGTTDLVAAVQGVMDSTTITGGNMNANNTATAGGVEASELEAAVAAFAAARGGGGGQHLTAITTVNNNNNKRGKSALVDGNIDEDDNGAGGLIRKQRNKKIKAAAASHLNDDNDVDDEGDDDDDDDDDEENDFTTRANTKVPKEPKKLSRRQQPPKTNITRTRYSNDFKYRIVTELQDTGYGSFTAISKHYGVAEQTLRDWMKHKDKIIESVQRRGNMKANPVDHLKHVTKALLKFMDDHYATGTDQPITARMIAQKGNEIRNAILAEDAARPYLTEGERKMTTRFSASLSWGKKWVRQYGRPKTTQVPTDLEGLSKEELVRLLRSVASEREALEQNQMGGGPRKGGPGNVEIGPGAGGDAAGGGGADPLTTAAAAAGGVGSPRAGTFKASSNLLPFIPSPPRIKVNTVYKVVEAKIRIADTLANLIKKKAHNWKGRPTTEMTEEVPTLEAARELMQGYSEINKTARSYRWQLTGEEIVEWLNCPKYVHPVKFEGKIVCTIGQPAYVYAFAGYDSMLVKYEQGSSLLTLKVKTYTAGTGNIPGSDEPVFLCNES